MNLLISECGFRIAASLEPAIRIHIGTVCICFLPPVRGPWRTVRSGNGAQLTCVHEVHFPEDRLQRRRMRRRVCGALRVRTTLRPGKAGERLDYVCWSWLKEPSNNRIASSTSRLVHVRAGEMRITFP